MSESHHALRVFLLDPDTLQTKKRRLPEDHLLQVALGQLVWQADTLLDARLVSVVEKMQLPASGDIHDYLSLAPYWWPDPTKPDGLPYIHRDGETNPQAREIPDKPNFQRMMPTFTRLRSPTISRAKRHMRQRREIFCGPGF